MNDGTMSAPRTARSQLEIIEMLAPVVAFAGAAAPRV